MAHPYGSPEAHDFFRSAPPTRAKQMSRWKEDWEELELLVRRMLVCASCILIATDLSTGQGCFWLRCQSQE